MYFCHFIAPEVKDIVSIFTGPLDVYSNEALYLLVFCSYAKAIPLGFLRLGLYDCDINLKLHILMCKTAINN